MTDNAMLKAILLSGRTVGFSERVLNGQENADMENHHHEAWVFIRLNSHSRVRLVISDRPRFLIDYNDNRQLILVDSINNTVLLENVVFEEAVIHAPDQLFLGLYEYCKIGCKFCPLSVRTGSAIHYSLDSIYEDISNSKNKQYSSIGITTAIPYHLSSDDVTDEMCFVVRKIREKIGNEIPIGVSTRIPSMEKLIWLKQSGANEVRLNLEVPEEKLSVELMPNKPTSKIWKSLQEACEVFGPGKVSSNIVLGLGESDDNVVSCIDRLASIGVIATLYPYDPVMLVPVPL